MKRIRFSFSIKQRSGLLKRLKDDNRSLALLTDQQSVLKELGQHECDTQVSACRELRHKALDLLVYVTDSFRCEDTCHYSHSACLLLNPSLLLSEAAEWKDRNPRGLSIALQGLDQDDLPISSYWCTTECSQGLCDQKPLCAVMKTLPSRFVKVKNSIQRSPSEWHHSNSGSYEPRGDFGLFPPPENYAPFRPVHRLVYRRDRLGDPSQVSMGQFDGQRIDSLSERHYKRPFSLPLSGISSSYQDSMELQRRLPAPPNLTPLDEFPRWPPSLSEHPADQVKVKRTRVLLEANLRGASDGESFDLGSGRLSTTEQSIPEVSRVTTCLRSPASQPAHDAIELLCFEKPRDSISLFGILSADRAFTRFPRYFFERDRVRLGIMFVSAVLCLHSSSWLESSWSSKDITFDTELGNIDEEELLHPYLTKPLPRVVSSARKFGQSFPDSSDFGIQNRSLYSLGMVLMELVMNEPLASLRKDDTEPEVQTAWRIEREICGKAGPKWADIISKCLHCPFALSPDLEDEKFASSIYGEVLKPLIEMSELRTLRSRREQTQSRATYGLSSAREENPLRLPDLVTREIGTLERMPL